MSKLNRFTRFFVILYVSVHFVVSIFGIRWWPFTDYPMFGWAIGYFEKVNTFHLEFADKDGQLLKPNLFKANSFGTGDFKLTKRFRNKDWDGIKFLVKDYLEPMSLPNEAHSVVIIEDGLKRKDSGEFEKYQQIVWTVDLGEL